MSEATIYHICTAAEWAEAQRLGRYGGSSQDKADGFIHFSTAAQVRASAAKHRAGQDNLVLVEAASSQLAADLKWEPSRGGALFPHLYGPLPMLAVTRTWRLALGSDGQHRFPEDL